MSEKIANNLNRGVGDGGIEKDRNEYQSAKEMLNDDIFKKQHESSFDENGWWGGDPILLDAPKYCAEIFGVDESIKFCDEKLTSAGITTAAENEKLYNRVDDILFDEAVEADNEENVGQAKYAELMKRALDGLVDDVKEYEEGEVQTLESVANHKIAKETRSYLKRFEAGSLTGEFKDRYAERVTILSELRDFLRFQRKGMRENLGEGDADDGEFEQKEELIEVAPTFEQRKQHFEEQKQRKDKEFERRMQEYREQKLHEKKQANDYQEMKELEDEQEEEMSM